MHDIRVGFALTAPNPGSGDATAKQDLAQTLADSREAGAVLVIESECTRPMNRDMGHQAEAD